MIRSIYSKILLSHMIVILISTITIAAMSSYLIRSTTIERKRLDLYAKGNAAIELLTPELAAGTLPSDETLDSISDLTGGSIWLINASGTIIAGQTPPDWQSTVASNSDQLKDLFSGEPQSWQRASLRSNGASGSSVTVAVPVTIAQQPLALFLDAPLIGINRSIRNTENIIIYSLVVGIFTAIMIGLLTSRNLTRPIADISRAAREFANGRFSSRTTATGNDEIGSLGRTFNSMAESLMEVEQNRRNFLANVSHELRTPVTAIQALSETILDGLAPDPRQQERYLNTIVDESKRLSRLIGDLLDLSQLEANELAIVHQNITFHSWLIQEIEKIRPLLAAKQLTLQLDTENVLPDIRGDADRLAQVLRNLITNAIRHSPQEGVLTITAAAEDGFVRVSITDQGSGISPEDLPYIWDRFYRGDKARARYHGGTGLGLAISRKLIQAMQGEISAVSPPGAGATFSFRLPCSR